MRSRWRSFRELRRNDQVQVLLPLLLFFEFRKGPIAVCRGLENTQERNDGYHRLLSANSQPERNREKKIGQLSGSLIAALKSNDGKGADQSQRKCKEDFYYGDDQHGCHGNRDEIVGEIFPVGERSSVLDIELGKKMRERGHEDQIEDQFRNGATLTCEVKNSSKIFISSILYKRSVKWSASETLPQRRAAGF